MKRWKITIEDQKTPGTPIVFEYDQMIFDQERGVVKTHKFGAAQAVSIGPNGCERIQINAWTGKEHWEDFVAREEKWE